MKIVVSLHDPNNNGDMVALNEDKLINVEFENPCEDDKIQVVKPTAITAAQIVNPSLYDNVDDYVYLDGLDSSPEINYYKGIRIVYVWGVEHVDPRHIYCPIKSTVTSETCQTPSSIPTIFKTNTNSNPTASLGSSFDFQVVTASFEVFTDDV